MKNFNIFSFEKFSFDEKSLKASFFYNFDNGEEKFKEIIDFKNKNLKSNIDLIKNKKVLNSFLFNLHIALGISYYKLFPTKVLEVKSGFLNVEQIIFWEKFYKNGLGEFFIKNNIDFSDLVNFKNIGDNKSNILLKEEIDFNYFGKKYKNLLLWGGGKDSIVSYSLLNKDSKKFDLFVFGKIDDIKKNTAKVAEKEILLVKRILSANLFELNKQGYYNGHVPITGIIAFVTFIVSYLYGYSNIILSNEKSASEENTIWKGLKINHQYSKSLEFEEDLNGYLHKYISSNINYFSLLRGIYEYKIAKIFSGEKKFFTSFSSCNRNFTINKEKQKKLWCCECEKCCFVFLILSPFLKEEELISIFGENLFDKISLEKTFRELIGLEKYKPFECVGTYEESLLSAKKAILKNINGIILKNINKDIADKCDSRTEQKLENLLLKI